VRVEPLHQLFPHRGIVEAGLRKVKDNKERETGIQCPVMIGIVLKGLGSVYQFLARGSAHSRGVRGDTHRCFRPAVHDELHIVYGMLDQYLRNLFPTSSKITLASGWSLKKGLQTIGNLAPFD
jgi:hypothetical protein